MSYPWIKDGQYLTPTATGYLAVTAPNGLYLTDGTLSTTITPTSVTSTTFIGALSGTATSATNVTIAEDNTNATFYPVFVSNNTGNLSLNVDKTTTPLSYNPSTGILVATSFSPGAGNSTFSDLTTAGLEVLNATSGRTKILNNQITCATTVTGIPPTTTINPDSITCSSLNLGSTTTITPTSVTATTFNGALSGTATRATNIAGGLGGQIPYQSAVNATALLAAGTTGQFLQSNGSVAPSWVNQNTAATPSGLPTTIPSVNTNQILTVNFNNSFSSVTRYLVSFTGTATTTQTITTYTLSGGVIGGQYTLVIQLFCSGGGTTTWTFNKPSVTGPPSLKSNFTSITTGTMGSGITTYVVLTFAYDGTNYIVSGSLFT